MPSGGGTGGASRRPSEAELARTALPDPSVTDPRIGKLIGDRYRIIRLLGQGGMGAVYEAEHTLIRRRLALKFLHGGLSSDPKVVKRFQNEAIAATSIGSPHIVEVTDMGRLEDGSFYMALEYLDGQELSGLLDAGPLTIARTVSIASQICDGLSAAHAAAIVHRDLKPDNIFLVDRDGKEHVKILDFGIAKLRRDDEMGMTATGHAMGTPYYMPPEQARGAKDADHRADLYSLGVILFESLAGQCPFQAESMPMLMVKILQEAPPAIRAFRDDVPDGLAHLIDRLLSKDPAMRPSSAAEVKAALGPFAGLASAPTMLPDAPPLTRVAEAPVVETRPMGGISAPVLQPAAQTPAPGRLVSATPDGAHAAPPTPSGRGAILAVSAIAAVALGGAGLWAAGVFGPDEDPPVEPDVTEVRPVETTTEEPAAPPPQARTVRVRIDTEPPGARLTLDGEEIPNPFDAEVEPRDSSRHVRAELEGFEEASREVAGRYPQTVHIALVETASRSRSRRRGREGGGRREPTAEPLPAPVPQPLPPEHPPAEPPGDELIRVRY